MSELAVKLPGNENDVATRLDAFSAWLGRKPDRILAFLEAKNDITKPGDFIAAGYFAPRYAKAGLPVIWSMPLCRNDKTLPDPLGEVITGKRDADFGKAAAVLGAFRPQDERVPVRLGWECNGDWFRWSEDAEKYKTAFQRVVGLLRAASPRFQLVWNVNAGSPSFASYYPGDAFVDVVSIDAYDHRSDLSAAASFDEVRTAKTGLGVLMASAQAVAKPWAIDEWGARENRHAFVEGMADYVRDQAPLWHGYWDSMAGFPGAISTRDSGSTGYAFRARFGADPRVAELEKEVESLNVSIEAIQQDRRSLVERLAAREDLLSRYAAILREIAQFD